MIPIDAIPPDELRLTPADIAFQATMVTDPPMPPVQLHDPERDQRAELKAQESGIVELYDEAMKDDRIVILSNSGE